MQCCKFYSAHFMLLPISFFFSSAYVQMVWIRVENKIKHIGWRPPAVMDSCENPLRFLPAEVHRASAGRWEPVSSFLFFSFIPCSFLHLFLSLIPESQPNQGAVFHVDILKSGFYRTFTLSHTMKHSTLKIRKCCQHFIDLSRLRVLLFFFFFSLYN